MATNLSNEDSIPSLPNSKDNETLSSLRSAAICENFSPCELLMMPIALSLLYSAACIVLATATLCNLPCCWTQSLVFAAPTFAAATAAEISSVMNMKESVNSI